MTAPAAAGRPTDAATPGGWLWLVVLVLIGVLAAGFAHGLARHGLIESPDSIVYEGTAANLHAGKGATVPISTVAIDLSPTDATAVAGRVPLVQFPPLFPAALAAGGAFGLSPADAARVLNPTLLGLNVLLSGLLVVALVGRARWLWALPVMAIELCGVPRFERTPMLLLHGSVLSEPLMLTFVLASLLAVAAYLRGQRPAWLGVAIALASLATATRFLGVAMVVVVAVVALVWGPGGRLVRLVWAAVAVVVGIAPTALFMSAQARRLHGHGHPLVFSSVKDAVEEFASGCSRWFLPATASVAAHVTLLGAIALLSVIVGSQQVHVRHLRDADRPRRSLRAVVVLLACAYAGVVIASRLVFDQNVALWGRHLELLWILVLALGADYLADVTLATAGRTAVYLAAAAAALVVAVPGASDLARVWRIGYRPPQTSTVDPRFADALHTVRPVTLVFSNRPEAVYSEAGRPALMVPCARNYYTHQPNVAYRADIDDLLTLVRRHRAVLVLDDDSGRGSTSCFDGRDAQRLGLRKARGWEGGGLYRGAT